VGHLKGKPRRNFKEVFEKVRVRTCQQLENSLIISSRGLLGYDAVYAAASIFGVK
jgi:hypothetical protein